MSRFKVEKERVAASLSLATGQTVAGCFFVLGSLATAMGRERVGDLLNAEDGFFPFQRDDGTTAQYNRAHVVLVRLPAGVDEEAFEPGYDVAPRRAVVMTLSTGAHLDGTVLGGQALAVSAAVTRVLAVPAVNDWLTDHAPWLAATPRRP